MTSVLDVEREEGLGGPPASALALVRKYATTSLTGAVRASRVLRFHCDVVTPEGTPLGGWVDLEIRGNGAYSIYFHMHSSSDLGDFDYDLRAYLSAPGTPAFFFHHSGHVSGVDDSNYPESGTLPLAELLWPQIASGATFEVAHDYSWVGLTGTFDRLADDLLHMRLLDAAAAAVGAFTGVVIAATREALDWLNLDLGPGGTLGVLAGVGVFLAAPALGIGGAGAVMLATTTGVAVGALTNALVSYTPLVEVPGWDLATTVFGDKLNFGNIMLTNLAGLSGRAFTAPGIDGKIYCNLGSGYDDVLGSHPRSYPAKGQEIIHELTHAWQIEHMSFQPGFLCSSFVNQADYSFGDDVYQYGSAVKGWSALNLEQQGAIVDQWFAGSSAAAIDMRYSSPQMTYSPLETRTLPDGSGYVNPYY